MSFIVQIVSYQLIDCLCVHKWASTPNVEPFKRALCSFTTSLTVLLIHPHSYRCQCKRCLKLKQRVDPRSILGEQPCSTSVDPQERLRRETGVATHEAQHKFPSIREPSAVLFECHPTTIPFTKRRSWVSSTLSDHVAVKRSKHIPFETIIGRTEHKAMCNERGIL